MATISPLYLLSGIGMMLVGILPVIYWRIKSGSSYRLFLFGGLVWTSAMVVKAIMDLMLSEPLYTWLSTLYPLSGLIVVWGLVVGLRTGFLECGFTYIFADKKLKGVNFADAVAFGIGFGATEAIILGFRSLMSVLTFVLNPGVLELLPPDQRAMIIQSFSNLAIIPAPILERFFTLLLHLFSSLLIIYAVQAKRAEYFIASFAYKSGIDGLVPWMRSSFDLTNAWDVYSLEGIIVGFGIIGLLGSLWIAGRFRRLTEEKPGLTFSLAAIIIVLATIILFAITIPMQK